MRLTQWTDYSLRVLMYCAAIPAGREAPVTITEIAQAHGISRSHLTKIVMDLAAHGLLETTRGRGGGLRLLRPAEEIRLGDVVRLGERDLVLVECFDPEINQCQLTGHCGLQATLGRALDAFMQVLDQTALADLIAPPQHDRCASRHPAPALAAAPPGRQRRPGGPVCWCVRRPRHVRSGLMTRAQVRGIRTDPNRPAGTMAP